MIFFQIKDETDEEDLESFSFNLETGDLEKPLKPLKTITKSPNRQYIFVTEDGKTAECFEDLGKSFKRFNLQINFQIVIFT